MSLSPEALAVAAFVLAGCITAVAVPLTIRLAHRTDFLDHPGNYKGHAQGTPYLGGTAVFTGVLAAMAILQWVPLVLPLTVLAIWLVGTIDDRLGLGAAPRIFIEILAAVAIWATGQGWNFSNEALDLSLTILWVLGVVNAWNLMDNMDGSATSTGLVTALGIGGIAYFEANPGIIVAAFALAGSCAVFLRHNLARPSRQFLGDGGSMPLGFLLAWMTMHVVQENQTRIVQMFLAGLLVGLPILDTSLVVYSRLRNGRSVLSGGRDHLTHRLALKVGSPRRVALTLVAAQSGFVAAGVISRHFGHTGEFLVGIAAILAGLVAIYILDRRFVAPTFTNAAEPAPPPVAAQPSSQPLGPLAASGSRFGCPQILASDPLSNLGPGAHSKRA